MTNITVGLWIFAVLVLLAFLSGRQRVTKIVAVIAILTGISMGTTTSWGPQVWPVIGDILGKVSVHIAS
jgi:disulfide bond formation protein DsbB